MPNIQPIFSRVADIQGAALLTAAADYNGQNVFNSSIWQSDGTNGGYCQKLRFKSIGGNAATVARIYINNGSGIANASSNVPQSLGGTPSGTGGNLLTSNLVAKVCSLDQFGVPSAWSAESGNVAISSATGIGSVVWNWNASSNANSYIITFGKTPGAEERAYLVVGANTFTQTNVTATTLAGLGYNANNNTQIFNNFLWGELSLPATTGTQTAGTYDIDYPINLALPPGYRIIAGLGTTVANGWQVIAISGKY
jgi:hypothetical protein